MITARDVIAAAAERDIYLANSERIAERIAAECNADPGEPAVNLGWRMDVMENEITGD